MNKSRALFMVCVVAAAAGIAVYAAESVGNPRPGYPHDTIIVHVMKADSGPKECDGGHALFLRHQDGEVQPATIYITMTDWVQVDNDNDGVFDEDPADGIDNDGNNGPDEDGIEPGGETMALDCDAYGDGEVRLQIRDANPAKGVISTQEWFMRLIGKPGQEFAFSSTAEQVSCQLQTDGTIACTTEWFHLATFNLSDEGCVRVLKAGGKAGGKTPFCDITDGFLVDVDTGGEGVVDSADQFVFSVSCWDDPLTEVVESDYCPLSSILWEVDPDGTTTQAKAQIFVAHTGAASVLGGKIVKK